MKKLFLSIVILFTLILCSCGVKTDFEVNEKATYIVFDNLMSLQMNEITVDESYAKGTFFLGFGSYESKTDYHMYTYITFWYVPTEGAYRKARLIEDKDHCIILIETSEEHYYITHTRGYVGGEYYNHVYRVYIPVGTVKVQADFTVE